MRILQLRPAPYDAVDALLERFPNATWRGLRGRLAYVVGYPLLFAMLAELALLFVSLGLVLSLVEWVVDVRAGRCVHGPGDLR